MAIDFQEVPGRFRHVIAQLREYFLAEHSFSQLDQSTYLRWGALALVALMVLIWHLRQNRQFNSYLDSRKKHSPVSRQLSLLARNRSAMVLLLFIALILAVAFYDTRIDRFQERLVAAQTDAVLLELDLADSAMQLSLLRQDLERAEKVAGFDETQQAELDTVKQEFEGLFINYYLLKKCGRASIEDFHIMHSALMYRLAQLNAPSGIRAKILDAASGSFTELYATQPCDDQLPAAEATIRAYLDEVKQKLPDR